MISFHSLRVAPKQDYLHSIHFHSFPFLYFKTSNQGYLNPFQSNLFHSFPLLKYIPFHSIPFHSLMTISFYSIPFYSIPLWTSKRSLNDPPVWLWEAPTWAYMEDDSSKWGRMCGSVYGFFFEGRCPNKGMYRDS